jgi:hypothetical protein
MQLKKSKWAENVVPMKNILVLMYIKVVFENQRGKKSNMEACGDNIKIGSCRVTDLLSNRT